MRKSYSCGLVLSAILFITFGWAGYLSAASEKAPISGTPMLRGQKLLLLRDYGTADRIKSEKAILGDLVGDNVAFYAYNFGTGIYYTTTATCRSRTALSSGYNLNIYVEDAEWNRDPSRFTPAILDNLGNEYKNVILPTETTYFGTPPPGDFTVLLMDIRDGGGDSYVAGYFDPRNENPGVANSNSRHMIYMDSKEGTPGNSTFYGTLAHEFQHFIHFNYDPFETAWVEEGLSGLARYVCGYGHQISHVRAFSLAPSTSLTNWQDDLANYGATYLFSAAMYCFTWRPTCTRHPGQPSTTARATSCRARFACMSSGARPGAGERGGGGPGPGGLIVRKSEATGWLLI